MFEFVLTVVGVFVGTCVVATGASFNEGVEDLFAFAGFCRIVLVVLCDGFND